MKKALLVIFLITTSSTNVFSEDIKALLDKVQQYNSEGNYSKALEELSWVKKELETKYMAKLGDFLPNTLAGMTGAKVETSSALGMTLISRVYTNGANSAKVELNSGSGGAASAGMGGLAALGQMAAMFGQQAGQTSLRIKGKTANLQDGSGEMTIFLDGGSMLTIKKQSGTVDHKALAEGIDFDAIEKFMKGAN